MEDMRAVLMYVDTIYFFTIDISAHMGTLFYDQAFLPILMSKMGKRGAEEAGTDYQIIIFLRQTHLSIL